MKVFVQHPQKIGFGPKFIKWAKIVNNEITGYVLQSGVLCVPIKIGCGCRQGDPISSYLFMLCAQIVETMTSRNNNIKGIKIN